MGINILFLPSDSFFSGLKILPVTMGALIALLVITDQPFKGQNSVQPDAFYKIMESMKTRKNGDGDQYLFLIDDLPFASED
ncbi:hypothetical protein [Polynucleobacter necessarius]|uniref:hypothetical protein n=1 Tax=Polynucleobacter necessarius TaxID=576610 RepID=UPI000E092548|nr:hypothetical protein [Polynucleobacter necessarius]